jgi:hypothetical protein
MGSIPSTILLLLGLGFLGMGFWKHNKGYKIIGLVLMIPLVFLFIFLVGHLRADN